MVQREVVGAWEPGEGVEKEVALRERGCQPTCLEGLEVKINA